MGRVVNDLQQLHESKHIQHVFAWLHYKELTWILALPVLVHQNPTQVCIHCFPGNGMRATRPIGKAQQRGKTFMILLIRLIATTRQLAQQTGKYLLHSTVNAAAHLMSFDNNSNTLIAMDNCTSNHIFGDPHDFKGGIMPMDPIKVIVLGKAQAMDYGNVSIKFRCDKGQ